MDSVRFYAIVVSFTLAIAVRTLYEVPLALCSGLALFGAVFVVSYVVVRRSSYLLLALVCFGLVAGCVRVSIVPTHIPREFDAQIGTKVALSGVITSAPDIRENGARLTVRISEDSVETKVLAVTPSRATYHTGDVVSVSGVLKRPEPFEAEGGREFAYDTFLAKDGIFGVIQPASVRITGRDTGIFVGTFRFLESVKSAFTASLEAALPEPESALAVGLIAGGKQGLGKNLLEAFTIVGLLQIIVLSGYNVMIVAEGIMKSLSFLPRRLSISFAGLGIIFFVATAGGGSSVIRAGLMAIFALVARATGKTYAVVRALFVTLVLMLLWNPLVLVYDPGLQFSFAATLGLILFTPYVTHRLLWIRNSLLSEIVATTISAQVAVLPILLWQTGNLSLIALPATILVMPAIPPAMALSAIAGLVSFLVGSFAPLVSVIIGLPAYVLLAYVIKVAEVSAEIPFAHVIITSFPFWIVIVCYGALGFIYKKVTQESRAPLGAWDSKIISREIARPPMRGTGVQQRPS